MDVSGGLMGYFTGHHSLSGWFFQNRSVCLSEDSMVGMCGSGCSDFC